MTVTFGAKARRAFLIGALTPLLALLPGNELLAERAQPRPTYRAVAGDLATLTAAHPDWARTYDYGLSMGGQILRLIKIQKPYRTGSPHGVRADAVLITGVTHGDEYLGIEDRLPAWLLKARNDHGGLSRFLHAGGVIYVVPVVNPDGYERNARSNNAGADLNRDFGLDEESHLLQPESRALARFLDGDLEANKLRLRLTVDYHCCASSLLFPRTVRSKAAATKAERQQVEIAGLARKDLDSSFSFGTTIDVLGYAADGTSKDYYHARYGALAFTFEGARGGERDRFDRHTIWWDHVFGWLADRLGPNLGGSET